MNRKPSIHLTGNRLKRARTRTIIAAVGIGVALMGLPVIAKPSPWLVWNASPSSPIGLYRVGFGAPGFGDLVLVRTPEFVADFAEKRGYIPRNVPLVKHVGAMPGDEVCAFKQAIIINGTIVAQRHGTDPQGRALPWWNECRTLDADEVFLLNSGTSASFDGRYFGPIEMEDIAGKLIPIWTR